MSWLFFMVQETRITDKVKVCPQTPDPLISPPFQLQDFLCSPSQQSRDRNNTLVFRCCSFCLPPACNLLLVLVVYLYLQPAGKAFQHRTPHSVEKKKLVFKLVNSAQFSGTHHFVCLTFRFSSLPPFQFGCFSCSASFWFVFSFSFSFVQVTFMQARARL